MSTFIDTTLLRCTQDAFVTGLLNGLGLTAIFNAVFKATELDVKSMELGEIGARSYKVPAFESVRSSGIDERITPDMQRVRKERTLPRFGRLDWVDVAFAATLVAKVQTLVAPLQTVTVQSLIQRLGPIASIADLRAKLRDLYPSSMVDDIFATLNISTIEDFRRLTHLFVELVGGAPPAFDADDPATLRSYAVPVRIKIVDGFDIAGSLQSAKLCRSILEHESIPGAPDGLELITPYAFVVLFPDAAVSDASIPGQTAAETKAAVGALFNAEHMFAQFIN